MPVPLKVSPAAQTDQSSSDTAVSNTNARARRASDDEILGLMQGPEPSRSENSQSDLDSGAEISSATRSDGDLHGKNSPLKTSSEQRLPENLCIVLEQSPEVYAAWQDAQEYRKTFETPEAARQATALLADLNRMDAVFFSHKPEDHAELVRSVAALDPLAFASLARAITELANNSQKLAEVKTDGQVVGTAPGVTPLDLNANREAARPRGAIPE